MYANCEPSAAQDSTRDAAAGISGTLRNSRSYWRSSTVDILARWYTLRTWSRELIRENAELRDHLEVTVEIALEA
eukprot:11411574-Prorocentrum_lima.AAC.1